MRFLLAAFVAGFGALLLYLGETDDSPGLGGIGLILIVAAVLWVGRAVRRARQGRDRA